MAKLRYLNGVIRTLRFVGCYPIDTESKSITRLYNIWQIFIALTISTTCFQIIAELLTKRPLTIEEDGPLWMDLFVYGWVTLTFFFFLFKIPSLVKLVNSLQQDFVYSADNQFEMASMEKSTQLADKLAKYWAILTLWSSLSLASLPLILGYRVHPIKTWSRWNLTNSPTYEIYYFWEYLAQCSMGTIYGGTDAMYLCLVIILAAQFSVLKSNIRNYYYTALLKSGLKHQRVEEFKNQFNIIKDDELSYFELFQQYSDVFRVINSNDFKRINYEFLVKNIRHHQLLIFYHKGINEIFRWLLFFKIAAVTCYMVFALFTMLTVKSISDALGVATYVFDATIEMFLYTFPGQLLSQSADLAWELYECPWYLNDQSWKRTYLLFQMKIAQPIEIKAGDYFVMSLPSFVAFIKGVYSYVTVLRQFTEDGEERK